MKTSPWLVLDGYCAVRIIDGGDIKNIADRVALIEKTPRVRMAPFTDKATDAKNWLEGRKGPGGADGDKPENELYGFYPPSRAWADSELLALGYEVPNPVLPLALPVSVCGEGCDSAIDDAMGRTVIGQTRDFSEAEHAALMGGLAKIINVGAATAACGAFTEETLATPGWYFLYPKYPKAGGNPKFVTVDREAIEGGYMKCKTYAGDYIGPITPPAKPVRKVA